MIILLHVFVLLVFPSNSSIFCLNWFLRALLSFEMIIFPGRLQKRFYRLKFKISLISISKANPTNQLHSKLSLRDISDIYKQNFSVRIDLEIHDVLFYLFEKFINVVSNSPRVLDFMRVTTNFALVVSCFYFGRQ